MGDSGDADQVILATGSYDHTIRLWQAHSGLCSKTMQHQDSQVNAMQITPDRKHLAAAGYQHVRMYDIKSTHSNPIVCYDGLSKNVTAVGFQEDGKWMYTGGEDHMARIWDMRSRNMQCNRMFQVNAPINSICLHPNQTEMIVADQSGCINVWDLRSDKTEQLIPEMNVSINCVDIDPDASYLAAVNTKGTCFVWSISPGKTMEGIMQLHPRRKLDAHTKYGLKCKFSPDSVLLATTSADQSVKIWQTSNFEQLSTLKLNSTDPADPPHGWMWDCAFSADSQYIVTASSDCMARLWNIEQGVVKREYTGHSKPVVALAFNDTIL